jgi:hypothetical protein
MQTLTNMYYQHGRMLIRIPTDQAHIPLGQLITERGDLYLHYTDTEDDQSDALGVKLDSQSPQDTLSSIPANYTPIQYQRWEDITQGLIVSDSDNCLALVCLVKGHLSYTESNHTLMNKPCSGASTAVADTGTVLETTDNPGYLTINNVVPRYTKVERGILISYTRYFSRMDQPMICRVVYPGWINAVEHKLTDLTFYPSLGTLVYELEEASSVFNVIFAGKVLEPYQYQKEEGSIVVLLNKLDISDFAPPPFDEMIRSDLSAEENLIYLAGVLGTIAFAGGREAVQVDTKLLFK